MGPLGLSVLAKTVIQSSKIKGSKERHWASQGNLKGELETNFENPKVRANRDGPSYGSLNGQNCDTVVKK